MELHRRRKAAASPHGDFTAAAKAPCALVFSRNVARRPRAPSQYPCTFE